MDIYLILLIAYLIFVFFLIVLPFFYGAPFDTTSRKTLQKMIKLAKIKKGDKVADLGSGVGTIVIKLARNPLVKEAHGYEINPFFVWISRKRIRRLGLEKKAFIHQKNFMKADFSKYNVIFIFQIWYVMNWLESKLKKSMKKGSKVVSNTWKFKNWKPKKKDGNAYLYVVS